LESWHHWLNLLSLTTNSLAQSHGLFNYNVGRNGMEFYRCV
jgi:hypothetical protein